MKDSRKSAAKQGHEGPLKSASKGSDLLSRPLRRSHKNNRIKNCSQSRTALPSRLSSECPPPAALGQKLTPQHGFQGPPGSGPSWPRSPISRTQPQSPDGSSAQILPSASLPPVPLTPPGILKGCVNRMTRATPKAIPGLHQAPAGSSAFLPRPPEAPSAAHVLTLLSQMRIASRDTGGPGQTQRSSPAVERAVDPHLSLFRHPALPPTRRAEEDFAQATTSSPSGAGNDGIHRRFVLIFVTNVKGEG